MVESWNDEMMACESSSYLARPNSH